MSVSARTYAALFGVSCGALMAEVALTRLFSFSLWYHFAYMTISVALLGYGAAGSVYYAFPVLARRGVERALGRWAVLSGLLFGVCLLVVTRVPLDPAVLFTLGKFNWQADPRQFLYLTIFYAAVTAPFFAAGLCITIVLSATPGRIPQLYFADLAGAAVGCIGAVTLLDPLGAPGVIVLAASLLAFAGLLFAWPSGAWPAAAAVALLAAGGLPLSRFIDVRPSQSKNYAQAMAQPGVQPVFMRWNPAYRVDVLAGSEATPMRLAYFTAWGLSERYAGPVPENLVVTHDGDAGTMLYKFSGDFAELAFLDHTLLRLPYVLLRQPDVLVIGVGGGIDVLMAIKNGARQVIGIELNPVTADLLTRRFADYTGAVFNRPEVAIVVDEGRNFVRRSAAPHDLIQITGIDTLAAVYSGAYVLAESYLYTVEAMHEYLDHLTPHGILAIVRGDWLFRDVPPTQVLRLLSIAATALEQRGVSDPSRHIVLAMSSARQGIPVFSTLVRPTPFAAEEVARLADHLRAEGFEPWHLPGPRLQTPAADLLALSTEERDAFLAGNPVNLAATTDDKPFFFNFLKWRTLLRAGNVRSDYTPAAGQLVLVAVLLQSVVFAAVLIVGPLALRGRVAGGAHTLRYLFYFACLGIGFIFVEISYMQRFTLFLGSPVFALSVVLATLLLASGAGSFLSGRAALLADSAAALRRLAVVLCVLNLAYIASLPSLFSLFLGNALAVRMAMAVVLLVPAGLIMGAFLPVGMRVLAQAAPQLIPWAWAANGVMSVVGSIVCIVLAMSIGFRAVNLIALGVYLLGVAALLGPARVAGER